MTKKIKIIKGSIHNDYRGILRFVNDFKFDDVVRFYTILHPDTKTIRAWQGHRFEKKWFYLLSGSFVIAWVKIDNFPKPSQDLIPGYHITNALKSEIVCIPEGYANGLKALEPGSEIMVFSNLNIEKSATDDYRYNPSLWFDWLNLKPLNKKP